MKLFAFDLDGTTLHKHINISEENCKALYALAAQGVISVPATGRSYPFVPQSIIGMEEIRYCITSNGAAVYDKKEAEPIYTSLLTTGKALKVQEIIQRFGVYAEYYDHGKIKRESKYENYDWQALGVPRERALFFQKAYTRVESYNDELPQGRMLPEKINLPYVSPKIYEQLHSELKKIEGIHITSSIAWNLEINDISCNKGNALRFLAKHLRIFQHEIAAIGDNGNDLEMITYAGIGIAMGNATDEVKRTAQMITGSCDENGLADAIKRVI